MLAIRADSFCSRSCQLLVPLLPTLPHLSSAWVGRSLAQRELRSLVTSSPPPTFYPWVFLFHREVSVGRETEAASSKKAQSLGPESREEMWSHISQFSTTFNTQQCYISGCRWLSYLSLFLSVSLFANFKHIWNINLKEKRYTYIYIYTQQLLLNKQISTSRVTFPKQYRNVKTQEQKTNKKSTHN